jgi:hypothetical protein
MMADDQSPQGQFQQQGHYPQGPHRHEKQDEKQGEKEQEKRQEKGRGMEEKYRHNPVGFVAFALVIIWLGVSLLLQNAGVTHNDDQGWATFAWGAGAIILAGALVRLAVPRFRRPVAGELIWGAIALGVGFGLWFGRWEVIWPIIIIAVGVAILVSRFAPRR